VPILRLHARAQRNAENIPEHDWKALQHLHSMFCKIQSKRALGFSKKRYRLESIAVCRWNI